MIDLLKERKKRAGKKRSPLWPGVRRNFLKSHPTCAACGGTKNLEVHHKKPFHLFPQLELVPSNLMTLCEQNGHDCHFHFGHLLDWQSYNPNVVEDTMQFLQEVENARNNLLEMTKKRIGTGT